MSEAARGTNSRGRRHAALALACGTAALVGVAAAPLPSQADAKRQTVDTSFAVRVASVVGATTNAKLAASFPLPDGVNAAKGCKGKVVASAKLGKKTKTWSGKLQVGDTSCVALIDVRLAKASFGKTVALTFSFDGNKAIASFKKKAKLTIVPPAPVPAPAPTPTPGPLTPAPATSAPVTPVTPAPGPVGTTPVDTTPTGPPTSELGLYSKGTWTSEPSTEHGVTFMWTVLSDGTIPGLQANNFKWDCSPGVTPDIWFAKLWFQGGLSAGIDGSVTGAYHYVSDDGKTDVQFTAKFKMTDDSVSGNMTAAGSYDYGASGIKGCHTIETFTGYHYGAVK